MAAKTNSLTPAMKLLLKIAKNKARSKEDKKGEVKNEKETKTSVR